MGNLIASLGTGFPVDIWEPAKRWGDDFPLRPAPAKRQRKVEPLPAAHDHPAIIECRAWAKAPVGPLPAGMNRAQEARRLAAAPYWQYTKLVDRASGRHQARCSKCGHHQPWLARPNKRLAAIIQLHECSCWGQVDVISAALLEWAAN